MKKSEESKLRELLTRKQMEEDDAHEAHISFITDSAGHIEWCRLSMLAKNAKFALEEYEEQLEALKAAENAECAEKRHQWLKQREVAIADLVELSKLQGGLYQ